MDAGFIPYTDADANNFIDIFNGNHSIFVPDIINVVDGQDDVGEDEE